MNRLPTRLRLRLAAALITLATASAALADDFFDRHSHEQLVDLAGSWRFTIGDNAQWAEPDLDDRNWSRIEVPAYWEDEGYHNYNGFAWYRRSFAFNDDPQQSTYLLLGRIDDTDEVYVNGTKVGGFGSFPPNYAGAWNVDRVYLLPPGLLREGRGNVVAVRVYDGGSAGGIVGHSIGIYTSNIPLPEIDLAGTWKFRAGDDPGWREPGCDETGFSPINVPGYWESAERGDLDGFGWYRRSFRAQPHSDGETLVLMLGRIDDTDEVYLNGTKIGGTGNLNDSDRHSGVHYYDQQRGYFFPASLLKEDNVVAVRVHDHGGRGGIYDGPIGIISQPRYTEYWEDVRRDYSPRRFMRRLFR